MIEIAAIAWASLATVIGFAACGLAYAWQKVADKRTAEAKALRKENEAYSWRIVCAEAKLRIIARRRSEASRKGNITRAAKRRELTLAKASELIPAPQRQAA